MMTKTDDVAGQAPARPLPAASIKACAELLAFGFSLDQLPDVIPFSSDEIRNSEKEIRAEAALILARAT